jgi:integral membrane protein (TIGR01906 family)
VRRIEAWVAGVALAVFALGLAVVPLQSAVFTRVLSARVSLLPDSQALPLAEAARRFVALSDPEARSELAKVMEPDAVTHLDDVRAVLAGARMATLILAAALGVWAGAALGRRRTEALAAGLRAGALLSAASVVLAGLVAVADFDAFFSAFHGLFFEPGTWTFPYDSVLIRLFPEPFWTAAGGAWAVLVLAIAGVYWLASWLLGPRASSDAAASGASERM